MIIAHELFVQVILLWKDGLCCAIIVILICYGTMEFYAVLGYRSVHPDSDEYHATLGPVSASDPCIVFEHVRRAKSCWSTWDVLNIGYH